MRRPVQPLTDPELLMLLADDVTRAAKLLQQLTPIMARLSPVLGLNRSKPWEATAASGADGADAAAEPATVVERRCEGCGEVYVPSPKVGDRQRYCTPGCRVRAATARQKGNGRQSAARAPSAVGQHDDSLTTHTDTH